MEKCIFVLFCFLFGFVGCVDKVCNENLTVKDTKNVQVVNGKKVIHAKYESVAALVNADSGFVFCTGTFISKNVLLTATHCVEDKDPSDFLVAYGYKDPSCVEDLSDFFKVLGVGIHKDYLEVTKWWNDIALVLVSARDEIKPSPILLEKDYKEYLDFYDYENNLPGSYVDLVGYGRTDETDSTYKPELRSGFAPVMWRGSFEVGVGNYRPAKEAADACFGDSGGPIYARGDKLYVAGVASHLNGQNCGGGTVYTLSGSYISWINKCYKFLTTKTGEEECLVRFNW